MVFFSSVLALWSRAYLHSGVMNGVTTGIGGVKRRFAGAQRSSSHIACARIHMIEVFVRSLQNIKLPESASFLSLTEAIRESVYISTGVINQSGNQLNTDPNMSRSQSTGVAEACSKDLQSPEYEL